ncbi:hypothetical protein CCY99_07520 [Helicobacter sp. 16-1353]|uniref:hypothetical protein n=1 Tax=Helicobacter sp. 16-1353 TaxID=2004996 RepID=UPI000DCBC5EE|nr:hypothetical protein [Helicobacter sp. 16-1353]RAX52232.1 hypothetical protein CCY99_07520 [Helicobacter sp. 16-1353]
MIKKILLISALMLGVAFGATFDDNIKNLIEKQTGTKVKIVKNISLKDNKDLKLILVEIIDNAQRIPMFATKDGSMIIGLSNILFTSSKADEELILKATDEASAHNESSQKIAAGNLIQTLKPEQYISLKSSAKNPKTYFIISDPNCGYCREELKNINDRLKTHNVNIVMVGILGEDSLKKAAYVMSKVNSQMSQKDKLNVLQEVFSSNFKAPKTIDTSAIQKTTESLFKTGVIQGVPFIYESK